LDSMGDVWQQDKLLLFLLYFLPGFIASEIYRLFISSGERDFAKQLPAVIAYSAIHYSLTLWIYLIAPVGWPKILAAYVIVLVLPLFWAPVILLLRNSSRWKPRIFTKHILTHLLQPEYSPWDQIFSDGTERWVRIRLKSGNYVGGLLARGSVTSTFPAPEQIYVSNEWKIDGETGEFAEALEGAGLLVNGSEIEVLELIEGQPGEE
jgi:hypothetical protein